MLSTKDKLPLLEIASKFSVPFGLFAPGSVAYRILRLLSSVNHDGLGETASVCSTILGEYYDELLPENLSVVIVPV
jgi:hypothetical protein